MINWKEIPEYNEAANGLKIVYFQTNSYWLAAFEGEVFRFDSEPEMDEFLEGQLGFSEQILDEGTIFKIE